MIYCDVHQDFRNGFIVMSTKISVMDLFYCPARFSNGIYCDMQQDFRNGFIVMSNKISVIDLL
jgi:hypothetical protein